MAWKVLIILVMNAVFRIVNATSICVPKRFGTHIDVNDCLALEDEIYLSLEPDQDYTVTRNFSLYNPDRRRRVPQGKTLRSCAIGFDIADADQQMIETTVLKIRLSMLALINDCVAAQEGHSGYKLDGGLVFVLSNPRVVDGYGTCLAAQTPSQPKPPQRLNLLQCMNRHGLGPTSYHGMTRRAALPVPPRSDSPAPERYTRPPRPPNDRGRGRGTRGQSPNPGGQSPRVSLDQPPPQTYYAGPRTPSGSAYREQSPGTEGSVYAGHGIPSDNRENSPELDVGDYPPLPPAHGSASIPNIPHGGYLPHFHQQYHYFQAHDPTVHTLGVPSHSSPGLPGVVFRPAGPIAQGLQDIPGVPTSAHHLAGPNDQDFVNVLNSPSPGPSHGNPHGVLHAGSQPGSGNAPQGGAAPPSAHGELSQVAHSGQSYAGAVQVGAQAGAPPSLRRARTPPRGLRDQYGLPNGAVWVPYPKDDTGSGT